MRRLGRSRIYLGRDRFPMGLRATVNTLFWHVKVVGRPLIYTLIYQVTVATVVTRGTVALRVRKSVIAVTTMELIPLAVSLSVCIGNVKQMHAIRHSKSKATQQPAESSASY